MNIKKGDKVKVGEALFKVGMCQGKVQLIYEGGAKTFQIDNYLLDLMNAEVVKEPLDLPVLSFDDSEDSWDKRLYEEFSVYGLGKEYTYYWFRNSAGVVVLRCADYPASDVPLWVLKSNGVGK